MNNQQNNPLEGAEVVIPPVGWADRLMNLIIFGNENKRYRTDKGGDTGGADL